MQNFGLSMLCYWAAYIIVTCIGVGHTMFNIVVLKMPPMDDKSMGIAYAKTKPWHPLYNLLVFPFFAWFYLRGLPEVTLSGAFLAGAVWLAITTVVDLIGWVLIKHPWSLTPKGFYIEYQPWISFIYLVIFASPVLVWLML